MSPRAVGNKILLLEPAGGLAAWKVSQARLWELFKLWIDEPVNGVFNKCKEKEDDKFWCFLEDRNERESGTRAFPSP